jgi:hypothetical protein
MSGLARGYTKDVWRQRKVNAIYPPGEALKLGDIYEYANGVYRFRSTLHSRGQKVTSRPQPERQKVWNVQSSGTSRVVTKLKGKSPEGVVTSALGKADAGAIVEFSDQHAYVMSLSNIEIRQVTNLEEIFESVRKWYYDGDWSVYFLIVTAVWRARSATILTSGADKTQVELKADAQITSGTIDIADISTGFTLANSGMATDSFVGEELTPLFRAHRYSDITDSGKPAGRRGGVFDKFYDRPENSKLEPSIFSPEDEIEILDI